MRTIIALVSLYLVAMTACTNGTRPTAQGAQSTHQEAISEPRQIAALEAWERIRHGALLIDVRSPQDYAAGHLDEAINIPHTDIAKDLPRIGNSKEREIVLYCGSGRRAGLAQQELIDLGYRHVYNAGGYAELLADAPSRTSSTLER